MSFRGHLVRLLILVVAGLALTAVVDLPTWTLPLIVLDSPLTLQLTGTWAVAGMLGLVVCAGTDVLVRLHPARSAAPLAETARYWILPGLMMVTATLLVARLLPRGTLWWLALATSGALLTVVWLAQLRILDATGQYVGISHLVLAVMTYGLALVVFTATYAARVRTALSGTAAGLTAVLLALWLLSDEGHLTRRGAAYGLVIGLLVGTATWVLNHRPVHGAVGGVLLLLLFYVVTSMAREHGKGQLSWRTVVELVVVVLLVVLLVVGLGPE